MSDQVPFGPLAFMPGKMVHTNEITVLLGDNWFAKCSAKQAQGIVGHRKQRELVSSGFFYQRVCVLNDCVCLNTIYFSPLEGDVV